MDRLNRKEERDLNSFVFQRLASYVNKMGKRNET